MDRGDLDIEQRGRVAEGLRFSVGGVDDHAGVVEVRHDLRNDPAEPVQAVGRRNYRSAPADTGS